jgi:hypothetical protein
MRVWQADEPVPILHKPPPPFVELPEQRGTRGPSPALSYAFNTVARSQSEASKRS